jgi:uncharacterized protein
VSKHQQRFKLDVLSSALVHNFNNIFSNGHLYRAGQSMNSLPSQIPNVSCYFMGTVIKSIATILLIFLIATNCSSQIKAVDKSKQRDTSEAYQFKDYRQLIWDSLPKPKGWANDFEFLFTMEEETTLDSIISEYKKKTNIEICIVTIDTTFTTKEKFDDFVLHIHNTWGVGEKIKNNGIVIGISAGYRQMRISNGFGIENLLSDEETKQIIDNDFIPLFKKSDYYGGTLNGLQALIKKLNEKIK